MMPVEIINATLLDGHQIVIDKRSIDIGGSWQISCGNDTPIAWDMATVQFIHDKCSLIDKPILYDIGANTGSFSLLPAINPNISVIAFEPAPEAYSILLNNISLNRITANVKTFNLAIGEKQGCCSLKIPSSGKESGLACIGDPKRFQNWDEIEVKLASLDIVFQNNCLPPPDILKIDTEGCELFVLRGAERIIRTFRPSILIEYQETNAAQFGYHPSVLINLLDSWGYKKFIRISHEDLFFVSDTLSVQTNIQIPITSPDLNTVTTVGKPPVSRSSNATTSCLSKQGYFPSRPRIDLIVPGPEYIPFSWNQREGWIDTLRRKKVLNQAHWIWDDPDLIENLFTTLESSTADFIFILCGDHHLDCLHNTRDKKERWKKLCIPVLCHSIERIIGSPFPNTVEMSSSAVETYDAFVYIDELSSNLFEQSGKPAMWIPQYVDGAVFQSKIPFDARDNRIYFRGKTVTYGIDGVYRKRRNLLEAICRDPMFCLSEANEKEYPIQLAAEQKASFRFVLNAPANCSGYSSSLYEGLACGSAVFQYSLQPEEIKSISLFQPGYHYIEYSADDPAAFLREATHVCKNWHDFKGISRQGYEECLSRHTIEVRLDEIVEFMAANWSRIASKKSAGTNAVNSHDVQDLRPTSSSELENIIPPEVKADELYHAIENLAKTEKVKNVLEIGSSSGCGSTEAFVSGLRRNINKPTLYCMEVSKNRFEELRKHYEQYDFVKCYNASSVSLDRFPEERDVVEFYGRIATALNRYPLETVLGWLRQDREYVRDSGVPDDGIQRIKRENCIDRFDMVFIDGSEFTGSAELEEIYGAGYIILDDINAFKNYYNYRRLKFDPNYILVEENWNLRNGYAVFRYNSSLPVKSVFTEAEPFGVKTEIMGSPVADYKSISSRVEVIEGFMVPGQEEFLFDKVKSLPDNAVIVEIGAFKGRSTVAMGYACKGTNRRIFSVDTWDGNDTDFSERDFYSQWDESVRNNELSHYVTPVKGFSYEVLTRWRALVADAGIDFAFIDGSHQYEDVLRDFQLILPLVNEGGYIAFHDVTDTWPGPLKVWRETAMHLLDDIEYSSTLACGRKPKKNKAELPIHFFTIVLNGEPFIRKHIESFEKLPFPWHWHIVEGVAALKHDTAWSLSNGGRIDDTLHDKGLSNDGTSAYLDDLACRFPDRVTIYRKVNGAFWDGKLEMVRAPLANIREECLLWQVDADEIWTTEQMAAAREMFLSNPEKSAAFYLCQFFVGPNLVITTVNTYGNHLGNEWIRTWRFIPGDEWLAHEPPRLVRRQGGVSVDVASSNPFMHTETVEKGLVFHHYAYATEEQIRFKEIYYGYAGAVEQWRALQKVETYPVMLKDYFAWVRDETRVDRFEGGTFLDTVPKRILWIRTDAIGDNVLSSGMLPHIAARYPGAKITVFCQDRVKELYQASPFVDEIITFNWWKAFHEESYRQEILNLLQSNKFELTLNPVFSREALNDFFAIGSFASERIALHGDESNIRADLRDANNTAYTRIISSDGLRKLEMERHRDFLRGLGIDAPSLQPVVWTTDEDERFADEFFLRNGLKPDKTVAFYPSGQWEGKLYGHYHDALVGILGEYGLSVVAFGGAGEKDLNSSLLRELGTHSINVAGGTTIRQTAALLRRCRIGIGADTGTAHIASAVGTPHVVVMWGGHFGRFFPYSPLTSIVCLPLECYGCNWKCPYVRPHCVKDIHPAVVEVAFRDTLRESSELPRIFVQDYNSWHPEATQPKWDIFTRYVDLSSVSIIPVHA